MSNSRILVVDDSPTIRKVVHVILSKAGHDVTCVEDGEQGLTALDQGVFDLVLLDFMMPKVNGHQFCMAIDKWEKPAPPIVLMSARGDQIGDRFVQLNGVVDYVTKPFSPEALLAVTDGALRKRDGAGRSLTVPPGRASTQTMLDNIRAALAKRLTDAEILAPDKMQSLETFLEDSVLFDLARSTLSASSSTFALYGVLQVVPLAEVLQLLELQSQTGVLWVRNRHRSARLAFGKGRVQLALGSGLASEHIFGQILLREGLIDDDGLARFLEERKHTSVPLGEHLVSSGYISEDNLQSILETQTCEIVYEALRWTYGSFEFEALDVLPREAESAALNLPVQGLVMEGLRRVDEWHLIEREIGDFDQVFAANDLNATSWGDSELTDKELEILKLIDGTRSVRNIIRQSRRSSFDVANILYRFLSSKLVRRQSADGTGPVVQPN